MNKGESKNVDIDQDGKDDIQVTFHKKFDKHADITVQLMASDKEIGEEDKKGETQKDTTEEKQKGNKKGSVFVVAIVIIIIVIVGVVLVRNKRR